MEDKEKLHRKEYDQNEAWTATVLSAKAFSNPESNEVLTLSELNDNEIRLMTQALIVGDAFKTDKMREIVVNMAMLKRSKDRKGEASMIKLIRNANTKVMQTVQQSRFKKIMTNRDGYDAIDQD